MIPLDGFGLECAMAVDFVLTPLPPPLSFSPSARGSLPLPRCRAGLQATMPFLIAALAEQMEVPLGILWLWAAPFWGGMLLIFLRHPTRPSCDMFDV